MADEINKDISEHEVQPSEENTSQQTNILKQIKNILAAICCPYSEEYDDLSQSFFLIVYLNAIVVIFVIIFITKELSFGKDNGETSHFVQDGDVDILLISYMTPAILWTVCLFLMKDDSHVLVFDRKSISYKRPLFYSLYVFGGAFFLKDILQVALQLRCGINENVHSIYLLVEAIFVLTQLLFQVIFLNASFLARISVKLAVVHMIGSNISVLIHGIFRKDLQRTGKLNSTISYCDQTENALGRILDTFRPLNLQFTVITLVTLIYIFNNIKESNEIRRYSPNTKILRCKQNLSVETTLGKSRSECTSESSIVSSQKRKLSSNIEGGLLTGLLLALMILIVGQLQATIDDWSELIIVRDICNVIFVSAMLISNCSVAWVLNNYHPYYDWIPFTPTEVILFVAAGGYYASNTFNIVLVDFISTNGASISFIIKGIFRVILVFVQTSVISKTIVHSLRCRGYNKWRNLLSQSLTFLVVCNAAMSLDAIFFPTAGFVGTDVKALFNTRTWTVIASLTHSLDVFYFLHSSICFLDISYMYQQETVIQP